MYPLKIKNQTPRFLGIVIWMIISMFVNTAFAAFTIEDEINVGREFYEKLEKGNALVKDRKVNQYINDLGRFILSKSNKAPFEFKFYVIKSSAINAFATPGGYVYINRGLINLTETESQLAGVLAHEIAHVNARHIATIISKSQKINIATLAAIIAGAFLGGGGEVTSAVMGFSLATATHLNLKFSRDHEEEADRLGANYMLAAGYDVSAMLDFLRLMRRYEFYSNTVPSYFLTHPETDARLRYLDSLIQTTHKQKGRERVYKEFKKVKIIMMLDGDDVHSTLKYYQNETRANPQDSDAFYGLGMAQSKLGMLNDAVDTLQKAHALAPHDEDILRQLGVSYIKLGQTTEALSYLLKAHDLNPEDLDSVLSLGKAYEATGNHAQALAMYKQVELHNPDDDEIYYHLAMIYGKMKIVGESHYYFGVYFKKKERQQSALFHFREALKFFSKNQQKSQSIDNEIRELSKKKKK